MTFSNPSRDQIAQILRDSKVIAVVGLSSKEDRPSNLVGRFLQGRGFRIIPVNPAESEILGERSYASLSDIPTKVDIVDVFRKSESVPEIAEEAVKIGAKTLWLQEGVRHDESASMAAKAGLIVVQDLCVKKVLQGMSQTLGNQVQ